MADLELGLVGNCTTSCLIDRNGTVVWWCLPRFDGDPVFSRLLDEESEHGSFGVEISDLARVEQSYIPNTAVLVTRLVDASGDGVEMIDFMPRFYQFGRIFRPTTFVRILRPFGEMPRIRIRLRPTADYGATPPRLTRGSNHIRYVFDGQTLRLTTNAPLTYLVDETPFLLEETLVLILGPDETLRGPVVETGHEFLDSTLSYWRGLAGRLSVPFEWQDAVIRSAITLKLCSFEETGAIVAAMTTSIPEVPDSGRNWDYRFCWLRDAYFVVRALNRLGYIGTMEDYLLYLNNIVAGSEDGRLQPVYGIGLEARLGEHIVESLAGYRGMGPVRRGNQAWEHDQHDAYGAVILAVTQAFFDRRLLRPAGRHTFQRLESLGEQAFALHDRPDASIWEYRGRSRVHTHSSMMCWAACDRLARIAKHLGLSDRSRYWSRRAARIRETILARAWNAERNTFVDSFGGADVDASLLLMYEVGFLKATDPRFAATVAAIERDLKRGPHLMRYISPDDFGEPENAFIVCSFWYIDALVGLGRLDEARELFEELLASRNRLGLLSEDINAGSGDLWGNFPQTYSHVGLINCAMKLSKSWEDVV
jgi:GH15 family glucan-1,4-alpha-glucosidase